jgi:translation initiation factor 1
MSDADGKTPFHNPFTVLSGLRGDYVAPDPPAAASDAKTRPVPRAVVRMERSGRGGKEVTVIEHLDLNAETRERWLKELKAALGCGGSVEGESIALQGDQRKRVPKLLSERGVRKITVA